MAKIIIGNVKGKDGRGISKITKTSSDGLVDTYTITYTDSTTSTFTIKNADEITLQRQIVPSASIEASNTASQAYKAGDYVVASGVLRKVTAAIAKGNSISDSNSTATTVTGELANIDDSAPQTKTFYLSSQCMTARGNSKAPVQLNVCGNFCALYVNAITTRVISEFTELVDSDSLAKIGEYLPADFDSEQQRNITGENKPVGCRLCGGSDTHLWLIKDTNLGDGSEMRFVFTWVR